MLAKTHHPLSRRETKARVVKGVKYVDHVDAGDPVEQALEYDRQMADELVFLDITASRDKRDIVLDMVRRVAEAVFIPFTVGGGVRTVQDIRDIPGGRGRQDLHHDRRHPKPAADHRGRRALREPVHRGGH